MFIDDSACRHGQGLWNSTRGFLLPAAPWAGWIRGPRSVQHFAFPNPTLRVVPDHSIRAPKLLIVACVAPGSVLRKARKPCRNNQFCATNRGIGGQAASPCEFCAGCLCHF